MIAAGEDRHYYLLRLRDATIDAVRVPSPHAIRIRGVNVVTQGDRSYVVSASSDGMVCVLDGAELVASEKVNVLTQYTSKGSRVTCLNVMPPYTQ